MKQLSDSDRLISLSIVDHKDGMKLKPMKLSLEAVAEKLMSGMAVTYLYDKGKISDKNFLSADFVALMVEDGPSIQTLKSQDVLKKIGGLLSAPEGVLNSATTYLWFIPLTRTHQTRQGWKNQARLLDGRTPTVWL